MLLHLYIQYVKISVNSLVFLLLGDKDSKANLQYPSDILSGYVYWLITSDHL